MKNQQQFGLSRKSRGILYKLKTKLQSSKLKLITHICNIFQYRKEKFKKKQFQELIKKYDNNLLYNQIDDLFDELDQNKNGYVFYQKLQEAYDSIGSNDNPVNSTKNSIMKTVLRLSSEDKNAINIIEEVKTIFLSSEDIFEIISLFDSEREGYLSKDNVIQILNNFGYSDKSKRSIFIQSIFQGKGRIKIDEFINKLDLGDAGKRVNLSDMQLDKSLIVDLNKSQFIKDQQESIHFQESFALQKSKSADGYMLIDIQNIPVEIQPFYNYGSQLDQTFAIFASQYLKNKCIFIDAENPPYTQAYGWIHIAERTNQHYFLFQMAKSVLQRDKNRKGLGLMLEPKDIIQGSLGDCYFLSAVAGVVQKYPQLIYRLFVLEKNPSHIYGIRLFIDGVWKTIIVDACFPISRNGHFCGAQPHHSQIWVMLLQKAWAKAFLSYDNIHSGYNQEGLNAVSGAPSIHVSAQQQGFLKRIQVELNRGSIITCASSEYVGQMTPKQQDQYGIYSNHAYSLMEVFSGLVDQQYNPLTLLKVRNPWGRKEWKGNWSFRSPYWTPELRKHVNYENDPKDGSFFMSYENFAVYFDHVNICRVNLSYRNSWIEINADRQNFMQTKFKITQPGYYYFTIYQQNVRKYKKMAAYQKSKSWNFLCELKNGSINAINSGTKDFRDNTIEAALQVGEYVILSKVAWKYWQNHAYTLTSYGPERVKFKLIDQNSLGYISSFIQSRAKLGFGKVSYYQNANIIKRIHFDPSEGFGFILIHNQEKRILQTTIYFDNCKGLEILLPHSLPLILNILPGEQIMCKFLVDPKGYSYSFRESYRFVMGL